MIGGSEPSLFPGTNSAAHQPDVELLVYNGIFDAEEGGTTSRGTSKASDGRCLRAFVSATHAGRAGAEKGQVESPNMESGTLPFHPRAASPTLLPTINIGERGTEFPSTTLTLKR